MICIFFRLIIWSQMILLISTLTLGTAYILGLGTNNVQLASLLAYPALESSTLFLSLVLTLTVLVMLIRILVTVRAKISKPQVNLEVKRRLLNIGDQVKSMMQIERPVKFFVGMRSYNASVRKNRVIVGERFLRDSTDQEIQGVIGHELAHIKGKDITKKAVLQGTAVLVLFVPYAIFESSNTALILAGTLLSLVLLLSVPINWRIELGADAKAAEYLGPEVVIQALEKLKTAAYTGISFTHPPMSRRIDKLRRYHSKHETEEFFRHNGFLEEEPWYRQSRRSGPLYKRSKGSYVQEHPQALSKSNPSKSTLKKGVDSKISHIIIPDSLSCTAVVRRRRGSR